MFDKSPVGTIDLIRAESWVEFQRLWAKYEAEPALLLTLLLIAILIAARTMTVSPLDRRSPQRGTHYLGNVRLGQNAKVDGPGPLRTRLQHDPEYDHPEPTRRRGRSMFSKDWDSTDSSD
ncbi:MAG: hypothetical protein AAGI50_01215 [Pseudomonadota bacterium]